MCEVARVRVTPGNRFMYSKQSHTLRLERDLDDILQGAKCDDLYILALAMAMSMAMSYWLKHFYNIREIIVNVIFLYFEVFE